MREQLTQYVSLLFAGTTDCDDVRQEILQNTLDRYDDLIAQGKSPEAAYRLAISGIGDIGEILNGGASPYTSTSAESYRPEDPLGEGDSYIKKILRTIAIALFILCPVPILVLSELNMDVLGICGTLTFVAAATVLIILGKKSEADPRRSQRKARQTHFTPGGELRKSVKNLISAICLALYFIISFVTGAWYITWVIFLLIPAIQGLAVACLDLWGGK